MKTTKKLALLFGVAAGAAVALMAFGKTGKKTRNVLTKRDAEVKSADLDQHNNDMFYI